MRTLLGLALFAALAVPAQAGLIFGHRAYLVPVVPATAAAPVVAVAPASYPTVLAYRIPSAAYVAYPAHYYVPAASYYYVPPTAPAAPQALPAPQAAPAPQAGLMTDLLANPQRLKDFFEIAMQFIRIVSEFRAQLDAQLPKTK